MSKEAENLMKAMKELNRQTARAESAEARVKELEHQVEFHPWRVRDLETMIQNEHKLYADAHERMLKAEARVKELEASIARIHSFAGRGDGHGSLAATEACLADTFTMLRIDYDNAAKESEADAARITDLESQLAAAREGKARVWEERNRELVRELEETRAFLRRTATAGGSIVSSASMTPKQIAIARAADRMIVMSDGYGFVYVVEVEAKG